MELKEVKKLKRGTPVKVVYRKFPYIGKFHCVETDHDATTGRSIYCVWVTFVGERMIVKAKQIFAIDGLTETK